MQIWPGRPFPLGATYDGRGTNFSVFSEVASRVDLCLFDEHGHETCVRLPEVTALCWHGYLPGFGPGQRYGFRVHGPWAPDEGHWCNPAKLLLDPYAKATSGEIDWDQSLFGYDFGDPDSRNDDDSAAHMLHGVVFVHGRRVKPGAIAGAVRSRSCPGRKPRPTFTATSASRSSFAGSMGVEAMR